MFSHRAALFASPRHDELAALVDAAFYDPASASPPLVFAVVALLIARRRERIAVACRAGRGSLFGFVPFVLGAGLLVWARQIAVPRLLVAAFVLELCGVALALGGSALLRVLALPLVCALLAMPLPPELVNQLVFPLQLLTVDLTSGLLDLLGRFHGVEGDLILYEGTVFQVIEGCSGLKSTLSLVLAAIVYADFVVRGPWARAAVVLLALPVGLGANAIRVAILVLGRITPDSTAHFVYGILMLVVAVVVLALLELLATRGLARLRPTPGDRGREGTAPGHPPGPATRLGLASAALVALTALFVEGMPGRVWRSVDAAIEIESLPAEIAGRQARSVRVDDAFLGSVWFQHRVYRAYDPPGAADRRAGRVRVFVGHEDVTSDDRSGFSPRTVIPRSGWLAIRARPTDGAEDSLVEGWSSWEIVYPDRTVLVLHRRFGYAPWGFEMTARWLGLHRTRLLGDLRSPLVVRIELERSLADPERDGLLLRQFAAAVEEWQLEAGGGRIESGS